MFKFEKLEIWSLALEYIDVVYALAETLPKSEEFNLKSQIRRAAVSVALNIAEGSTGQTDPEQARFLGLALRSLLETVACLRIIQRQNMLKDPTFAPTLDEKAETLARKIQSMRKTLKNDDRP